ncbi:MAG: PDZ domain-containing protein [Clostridiales bacterium]|nr:PDZ domain-containing protein [Clostridiales bacterium]
MNKKISLGVALSLIFIAIAASVSITMSVFMKVYNDIIKDLPGREKLYSTVSEIDELIRTEYYGEIDSSLLNQNVSAGYINGLGTSSCRYMTAAQYAEYRSRIEGKMSGIGVTAVWDDAWSGLYVSAVFQSSPAQAAGLAEGDVIVSVDEVAVTEENSAQSLEKLSGERLTTVNIAYKRADQLVTVSVAKGYYSQAVHSEAIGEIGYIKIYNFYGGTLNQFKNAVSVLQSGGVTSLVIDVRDVSEGEAEYAAQVADIIVPLATGFNGAIAKAVNRSGETVEVFSSDADELNMPMAVLVNSGTSGCGELFACAVRDFSKGQLIGTVTRGNCMLQKTFELSDGGAVTLSVAQLVPYKSEAYQDTGLAPDMEVTLTPEQESRRDTLTLADDPQVQTAFSLFA